MFEELSARELVDVITARARASATADAEKYAAIAELERRRTRAGVELEHDAVDALDGAAAEIGAALNIGHGRALNEVDIAVMLRDRFPLLGALFAQGLINGRRAWKIEQRTDRITDADLLAELDAVLAERIVEWGPLSEWKLELLIDAEIERIDPAAVHRVADGSRDREFVIGRDTAAGTTSFWGRMSVSDAAIARQQIARMARSVCDDDPRTLKQRRGDAHATLLAGATVLACLCGTPACPAASATDERATSVVVHVVTDQATLDAATRDPDMHGPRDLAAEPDELAEQDEWDRNGHMDEPDAADDAARPKHRPLAIIPGYGIVPPALLAELIARGAKVAPLTTPGSQPEKRYRPSAATARFVRLRDLTCRWPGCDRLAEYTDIDHTVPYPAGPTHPGNGKCYCRKHHLIKTFHAGWADRQSADGTVVITTPTGHTYTTKPGIRLLFPNVDTTTPAPPSTAAPPGEYRTLMMPRRQRTRAQAKADRIARARAENERGDPPPF